MNLSKIKSLLFATLMVAFMFSVCGCALLFGSTKPPENLEAVDLGLPSGTKWSNVNFGTDGPFGAGFYYQPYQRSAEEFSGNEKFDIVAREWGNGWRIPTAEQVRELIDNCQWEWSRNRVTGKGYYTVTGKNGNSIILPGTGNSYHGRVINTDEKGFFIEDGHYWTATPYNDTAIVNLHIDSRGYSLVYSDDREVGFPIRPVYVPNVQNFNKDDNENEIGSRNK